MDIPGKHAIPLRVGLWRDTKASDPMLSILGGLGTDTGHVSNGWIQEFLEQLYDVRFFFVFCFLFFGFFVSTLGQDQGFAGNSKKSSWKEMKEINKICKYYSIQINLFLSNTNMVGSSEHDGYENQLWYIRILGLLETLIFCLPPSLPSFLH